jgi:hypothetical protein
MGKCDAIVREARNPLILKPFGDRSGLFRADRRGNFYTAFIRSAP